MSDNPFAPPKSHVEDSDKARKPGSIWKGALIGIVVDIVGTTIGVTVISIMYMTLNITQDMSPTDIEDLSKRFVEELSDYSSIWGLAGVVLGFGLSLIGGYVCAIFAKERWKKAALIFGSALVIYGLYLGKDNYSIGENISISLLTFIMIYLGGWLREGRHENQGTRTIDIK